jgi:hypothetical protein
MPRQLRYVGVTPWNSDVPMPMPEDGRRRRPGTSFAMTQVLGPAFGISEHRVKELGSAARR